VRTCHERVFVSGCYDILHAGHVQFFTEARALGDHLTVCFASEKFVDAQEAALVHSLPAQAGLLQSLYGRQRGDGENLELGLDFRITFCTSGGISCGYRGRSYGGQKRAVCSRIGASYVVCQDTPKFPPVSTTESCDGSAPQESTLRVDFAAVAGCAALFPGRRAHRELCISPLSRSVPGNTKNARLGGSAAWALLNGKDGVDSELNLGWEARSRVISETGLCVWKAAAARATSEAHGDMLRD